MKTYLAMCMVTSCLMSGGLAAYSAPAMADCLGNDPVAAAKVFYQQHTDFYYADPRKLQGLVGQRLMKALSTNFDCSDGQECALDSDPWVDAQDGDVAEPITYELGDHKADQATVIMHYIFSLSGNPPEPQQISLKMQQVDQCWRVNDMITPRGDSVTQMIEEWFKTYGNDVGNPAPASPPASTGKQTSP